MAAGSESDCLLVEASLNSGGYAALEVGDLGDELDGALAGQEVVVGHAGDGNHGETSVLDLLELVGSELLGIVQRLWLELNLQIL